VPKLNSLHLAMKLLLAVRCPLFPTAWPSQTSCSHFLAWKLSSDLLADRPRGLSGLALIGARKRTDVAVAE
jgi:hypothetical protein